MNSTGCPALNQSAYVRKHLAWGNCPTCIEPNPDVAGIGVIIGIVGQAFLLNIGVLIWWFFATPAKKFLEKFREKSHQAFTAWADRHERDVQKVLLLSADTQAVTGLALTVAGLVQRSSLSTYHMCIISDLLSISANGQAVMLFYALHQRQRLPARTSRLSNFEPRLLTSLAYIAAYYALGFNIFKRCTSPTAERDCLLNYGPQQGNYGRWSIAEATLMLAIYTLAFTQRWLSDKVNRLSRGWQRLANWVQYSFIPIFIVMYFLWNLVDIITLKIANRVLLTDDAENRIEAFGQVVPIVLLLLVLLPLWDLLASNEEVREAALSRPDENVE